LLIEIKEINLVAGAHYSPERGQISTRGGDSLEGFLEKSCRENIGEF
jgi:hypothetical protein